MLWVYVEGVCFFVGGLIVFFATVGVVWVFWFLGEEFWLAGFPCFVCASLKNTFFIFYSSSVLGAVSRLLSPSMHMLV